jgi:hypothetical protein
LELLKILMNDEDYMKKAKNVLCNKCHTIGHYPIMCEVFNEEKKKQSNKSGFSRTSKALDVIDSLDKENACGTIFTWKQVFDSVKRFYKQHEVEINETVVRF